MAATKSRDVIGELYTSLCGDPELPADLQWRIYQFAIREKKLALLARLLSVPALDPALDAKLAEHDESTVRAAWIARPGRPIGVVLDVLDKARAGSVHTAAAEVIGLPYEVYAKLAADGRKATAVALLRNQDVPSDVKVTAARTFGATYKERGYYSALRLLQNLFADQLGLLEVAASQTSSIALVAFAAGRIALSEPTAVRLHEEVVMPSVDDLTAPADWEHSTARVEAVTAMLGQPALSQEQRLLEYHHVYAYLSRNALKHVRTTELDNRNAEGPRKDLPSASHPNLEAMRNARTPEEVAIAARLAHQSQDAELVIALASNPACGPETVASLLPLLTGQPHSYTMIRDLAAARARDVDVLAAIAVTANIGVINDTLLAKTGKPAEALATVVRAFRTAGKKLPLQLSRSEYLTPSVMGALPLSFTARKGSMLARRAVGDLLTTALDSESDWEMFETLGNAFDGPLENLLLACGYVAAPADGAASVGADTDGSGEPAEDATVDPDGILCDTLF